MRNLLASPLLYFGILVGIVGSSYFSKKTPAIEQPRMPESPPPSADFSWLSENQIREYYELKSMKERYEKADELLGKMVLALIAGKFIDFSTATSAQLQNSAAGRAFAFPPTPRCEPAIATQPAPAKEKPEPRQPRIQPSTEDINTQFHPGESESFPFSKTASYRTTMCDTDSSNWFVTSGFRSYFAAEPDPDSKSTDLVGSIASSSLQRSELTLLHCLKPSYKSWRVRITAQLKAENVRNGKMVIKKWNPDGTEANASNQVNISGTYDWKTFTLPIIVSSESFAFGFEMVGSGKMFVKDVKVIRVEDTYLYD